jgi:hypothetical protein
LCFLRTPLPRRLQRWRLDLDRVGGAEQLLDALKKVALDEFAGVIVLEVVHTEAHMTER